jgi:hypothetical protein
MERSPIDFERLDVYRRAIDFLALAAGITAHIPRGHLDLRSNVIVLVPVTDRTFSSSSSCHVPVLRTAVLVLDGTGSASTKPLGEPTILPAAEAPAAPAPAPAAAPGSAEVGQPKA